MLILGAHMSINKGFAAAARKTAVDYQANAMQIFTKSPRSSHAKPIDEKDAEEFTVICRQHDVKFVIAHSSYLLNFGRPLAEVPWAKKDILLDFGRLHKLNGTGVIIHVGKAKLLDPKQAIRNIIENAKEIISETEKDGLLYIIENTAGQGSEIGNTIEELGIIWKSLKGVSPRIKFCIDTSHLHGAGYDISKPESVQQVFEGLDGAIGIKNIACIHFNDSKVERGSNKDRHDHIGEGKIGIEGMKAIAKKAEKHSIPLICETPEKGGKTRMDDLVLIRRMLN
jgi:deoxyribonuclease IV